tara:strand:+ start:511 stop:984 length:474 start_codon:yes stop_codon:yes gene_type:complete
MKIGILIGFMGLCSGFLGGILGSLLISNVLKSETPLYGVVDTHKLIQKQVAVLLRDHEEVSEETLSRDVIAIVHRVLTTWYQHHHMIVFDKKHVLTPLPDLTKTLLKTMASDSIPPEPRLPGSRPPGLRPPGSKSPGLKYKDVKTQGLEPKALRHKE